MLRHILATGFLGILLMGGDVRGTERAGPDDSAKTGKAKKLDPQRQLIYKVEGLT